LSCIRFEKIFGNPGFENEASVPHYDRPNLEKMISRIVELYREFGDMEKADHWQNYLDEYLNAKDLITD